MTDEVVSDQPTVRQRALVLLSIADSVKSEGWGDAVAAQLREAAHDLLGMASAIDTPPQPVMTDLYCSESV